MKIVATMMVRDEVDIVSAMVEHHLAQGVDHLIVTDNASVDGTADVLADYASVGALELHHDPVHRKQQHSVVTAMARRARTHFAADWVINADADEFFVPADTGLTLRQALGQIPLSLGAFTARVTNMVGPVAWSGSGIKRLLWRDHRSDAELQAVGIHAQPTPNAIHRGEPDVVVAQGNHFVSVPSRGNPDRSVEIEVLHLPWRSWAQLEQKVINAGKAYTANPDLKPSPNHHGMADYRRYLGGRLRYAYYLRSPSAQELETPSYQRDGWLADHLDALRGKAVLPNRLEDCLEENPDATVSDADHAAGRQLGAQFHELEQEIRKLRNTVEQHRAHVHRLTRDLRKARQQGNSKAVGARSTAQERDRG